MATAAAQAGVGANSTVIGSNNSIGVKVDEQSSNNSSHIKMDLPDPENVNLNPQWDAQRQQAGETKPLLDENDVKIKTEEASNINSGESIDADIKDENLTTDFILSVNNGCNDDVSKFSEELKQLEALQKSREVDNWLASLAGAEPLGKSVPPAVISADNPGKVPVLGDMLTKSLLQWKNGIGYLPGTDLKFHINDLGYVALYTPKESCIEAEANTNESKAFPTITSTSENCTSCSTGKLIQVQNPSPSSSNNTVNGGWKINDHETLNDPVVVCENCGHFALRSELHKQKFCTPACEYTYNLDTDDLGISREKYKIGILKGRLNQAKDKARGVEPVQNGVLKHEGTNNHCEKSPASRNNSRRSSKSSVNNNNGLSKDTARTTSPNPSLTEDTSNKKNMSNKTLELPKDAKNNETSSEQKTPISEKSKKRQKSPVNTWIHEELTSSLKKVKDKMAQTELSAIELKKLKKKQYDAARAKLRRKSNAFQSAVRSRNFTHILSQRVPEPEVVKRNTSVATRSGGVSNKPVADFDWQTYMKSENTKAAPLKLFKKPAFPSPNPFKSGMVLEAIDPQHPNLFCACTIVEVQGYRMRVRFIGYSEVYDFWVNADSLDIFPCNWCDEHDLELEGPPSENDEPFNWHKFIVEKSLEPAPRQYFAIVNEDMFTPSEVKVGMKLEAADIKNQAVDSVCVATIASVMGDRFLVHFDSWDSIYDYWADVTSPFIHPVGWAQKNNLSLLPPAYYEKEFVWTTYLRETDSIAMPSRLFQPLPPVGFKKGMQLECVDKRNPFLIRVASVADVIGHFVMIHFDKFSDIYDYEVYELSPDLHPVGWCAHTGHPLQTPPPYVEKWTGPCPTFGCYGLGHIKGPKFLTHNGEKNCPYSINNYKRDLAMADRISMKERAFGSGKNTAVNTSADELSPIPPEPNSRRPRKKSNGNGSVKRLQSGKKSSRVSTPTSVPDEDPDSDIHDEKTGVTKATKVTSEVKPSAIKHTKVLGEPRRRRRSKNRPLYKKSTKTIDQIPDSVNLSNSSESDADDSPPPILEKQESGFSDSLKRKRSIDSSDAESIKCPKLNPNRRLSIETTSKKGENSNTSTATEVNTSPILRKNEKIFKSIVGSLNALDVKNWDTAKVAGLVGNIPGCEEASNVFTEQLVDGDSFLLLSQSDLVTTMGFELGVAVKIAAVINLLNQEQE